MIETNGNLKYRFENFGGIISSESPPFLAFVDRNYMRELKLGESPLWDTADESIGILSAPTEVHFAITNRCSAGCQHCYMDGGEPDKGELDTEALKQALNMLAEMNIFHVALGGGEALERPDLFEIADHARSIGLVPNLTVSGRYITSEIARKMKIFGQVNVSMDGIQSDYGIFRSKNMFTTADVALKELINAGVPTGINCVVGKRNYDSISNLFKYAKSLKVNEIEFLRFKPSGRGKELYLKEKTTHEQNIALIPMLIDISDNYKIAAKIDCSFVPMYCYHQPPIEMLTAMATYGCEAGNVLLGIRSSGSVSGCSFLDSSGISVFNLLDVYCKDNGPFSKNRTWIQRAIEPCKSCIYKSICKGGCHGVSAFITGDFDKPDPDCPYVVEYQNKKERVKSYEEE
jgi:radical SAM protein with 4Fe4S-binding SPASM domain